MNVNEPHRSSLSSQAATAPAQLASETQPSPAEDLHLGELLRTLRSLVAESPERQAKIEGLMRAYATGDLHVDADATASAIIDEGLIAGSRLR